MKNLYIYLGLSSCLLIFIISYFLILSRLIALKKTTTKLYFDNFALEEYIKTSKNLKEDKSDQQIHQENFLKFLSDSRDWAFNYIEDVQSGLSKFVNDVEPEIEYFKEYGDVGSMAPNYYSMKKIVESYEELKKLLPKEEEEIK